MSNQSYAYLYANLNEYFLKWYIPVVLTSGFLGTAFCFLFLFRSKMFPKNLRIWLISICIGDFLVLLLEGLWMFGKVWYRYDIRDINNVLCKIHISASNYFFYWSAYVQCLLSVQRCYVILNPLRVMAKHLSPTRLLIYLLVISLLLIFPILPYPLDWEVISGDCDPRHEDIYRLTTILDLAIWGLIPLIIMTTSTVIIWKNLSQRRYCFDSQGKFMSSPTTKTTTAHNLQTPCDMKCIKPSSSDYILKNVECGPRRNRCGSVPDSRLQSTQMESKNVSHGNQQPKRKLSSETHHHVTRILICMNFVYMTSVYPLIIYFLILNFIVHNLDKDIHRFVYYLFRSLCFLNACTNWIFYCLAGAKFRQQARRLIVMVCSQSMCKCCSKDNSVSSTSLLANKTSQFQHFTPLKQTVNGITLVTRTQRSVSHSETVSSSHQPG